MRGSDLRGLLLRLGRGAEARAAWKEELAAHPPKHDDWFGYAELCLFLGDEAEYRRARRDLLAQFGSTTDPDGRRADRTRLPAAAGAGGRAAAGRRAHRARRGRRAPGREFAYPYFLFAQGLARYRQGRFDDAIKLMNGEAASVMGPSPRLVLAMAQYQKGQKDQARKTLAAAIASYDWSAAKADNHDAWIAHILRREAEALILPGLPAFLEGKYQPKDNDERLALLGVCQADSARPSHRMIFGVPVSGRSCGGSMSSAMQPDVTDVPPRIRGGDDRARAARPPGPHALARRGGRRCGYQGAGRSGPRSGAGPRPYHGQSR